MITNTGKNIIAKYLIGQAPAFASYMAFGCGPKPLVNTSVTITYRQAVDDLVTLTSSIAHGFTPGSYIKVSGIADTGISGIFIIKSVPTTTTLTYVSAISNNLSINVSPIAGKAEVDYSTKKALDFEMFRVPITSRGYVTENGVSQVVLTAELPTEERYAISEIGIYSARSNPSATSNDSRLMLSFGENENWEYHTLSGTEQIPYISNAIGDQIDDLDTLQVNSNNPMFDSVQRIQRYETPRFLNRAYLVSGNTSTLKKEVNITAAIGDGTKIVYTTDVAHTLKIGDIVTISGMTPSSLNFASVAISAVPTLKTFEVAQAVTATATIFGKSTTNNLVIHSGSKHIHLNGLNFNFNKNAPTDEMLLAFSVINKDVLNTSYPDKVKVLVEFSTTDSSDTGQHARFEVDLVNGSGNILDNQHDFANNRYVVSKKQFQELSKTSAFNWGDVSVIKVYASIFEDDILSDAYFVALDALRVENVTTISPIYGLTGYSVISKADAQPIVKDLNTSNFTEFRFGMDVQ